ncbi:hypothetical protein TI39_contig4396g00003 [Zymoseptoria brevis]|uniref:Uncharacterized protein n=1 Tax=Zymoseptoria brevis TaxID=1047168 RepID=A0A0F4GA88_9PEZI|nr:hypothetical protein TI39_contig4396g00003 [Zymoseptoria brevis]
MSGHGYNQVVEVVGKADKKDPNSIDVERSAISIASADVNTNTTLLDVAAISSSIRERVYLMAQSKASERINVIVTFIVGSLQEWRQMITGGNDEDLAVRLQPNFNTQALSIPARKQTVLWAKCRSEDFIRMTKPARIMARVGISAALSFSI